MTTSRRSGPSGDHVLVLASTFPASESDPVPRFVFDQVHALAAIEPDVHFHVLAPHDQRSQTQRRTVHERFVEHRFHYFWPRRAERLAGRGIMPSLQQEPWLYLLVPFLFFFLFTSTLRHVLAIRPFVIYAHWLTPQGIVASWVSRLTGIPYVFTTHASDASIWAKFPLLGPALVRSSVRRAAAFTAVSRRSLAKTTTYFAPGTLTVPHAIIPMGVDVDTAPPRPTPRESASRHIVFIGRIVEKKGVAHLIDACGALARDRDDWTVTVAGEGPLLDGLKRTVSDGGLDRFVRFAGYVSGNDKRALLDSADVVVLPSIIASDGDAEGLPVALLEGLAAGAWCIATPDSGADDIVDDGVNGFLCAPANPDDLRRCLVAALDAPNDARARIAENARATAEEYRWSTVAAAHWAFLLAPQRPPRDSRGVSSSPAAL